MKRWNEAARLRYESLFTATEHAGACELAQEFEAACLSIGSEFLPDCAIEVRDGIVDSDNTEPEYWDWLCEQVEKCSR